MIIKNKFHETRRHLKSGRKKNQIKERWVICRSEILRPTSPQRGRTKRTQAIQLEKFIIFQELDAPATIASD